MTASDSSYRSQTRVSSGLSDIKVHRALFFLGLGLWLVAAVFQTSLWVRTLSWLRYVRLVAVFCILISDLFAGSFTSRSVLGFLITIAVAALSAYVGAFSSVGQMVIIAFCARRYEMKELIRCLLIVESATVLLIVAESQTSILPDYIALQGTRVRHFLGFYYTTYLSHFYLNIVLMYTYLRGLSIKYHEFVLLLMGNYIIFALTDSKNSAILVVLFLVLLAPLKALRIDTYKSKTAKLAFSAVFIICFLVSAYAFYKFDYTSEFGFKIDQMLTRRLSSTHKSLMKYDISLFGEDAPWINGQWIGNEYLRIGELLYIDNSYFNVLVDFGALLFVICMALLTYVSHRVAKSGDLLLSIILSMYAIHSLFDPQLLRLEYCGFLVLIGVVWLSERDTASIEPVHGS